MRECRVTDYALVRALPLFACFLIVARPLAKLEEDIPELMIDNTNSLQYVKPYIKLYHYTC